MPETPTMMRTVGSMTGGGSPSSGPGKTMVTSAELPRGGPGPGLGPDPDPGARGEEVGAESGGGAGPGLGGAGRDGGVPS